MNTKMVQKAHLSIKEMCAKLCWVDLGSPAPMTQFRSWSQGKCPLFTQHPVWDSGWNEATEDPSILQAGQQRL